MTRMKKTTTLIILCLLLCISFCACSTKKEKTAMGTWALYLILDDNGEAVFLDEYCNEKGIADASEINETYTFNKDGSGKYSAGDMSIDFTYTVDGNTLKCVFPDEEDIFVMTYDPLNDQIQCTDIDGTLVFARAN